MAEYLEGFVDVVFNDGPLYIKVNKGIEGSQFEFVPVVVKLLSTPHIVSPPDPEPSPIRLVHFL